MRRGLALAAAGAALALSTAPLVVAPARAQGGPVALTSSPITMTPGPGPGGNVGTNTLAVSGHFHVDGGFQPTIDWITVNLTWRGPAPAPQVPGPFAMCGTPPSGTPGPACGNDFDFKDRPLAPPPAYNGPYSINATAHASDQVTGGQDQKGTPNKIDFNLVVPPPSVTAVTATVDKNTRNVTLSWDRDATTPDVQSYWVWRKGPGDKDFTAAFYTPQLNTGARVTVFDEGKFLKGGDYVYQVETRRNGATGDSSSFVPSDRSKSQSNKVTVPEPPPGQTVPPTTAPKGGGPPPVVKGTPSGVNRNSGFSGSGSSRGATTPTSEAVTPDPGYVHGLPYAGGATPGDDNGSEGDNSAVAQTPGGRHTSNTRGILVPVAGGAILFLGALHLRIFKKRLDEPPTTSLTPV
jgi:hypothetical protein